MAETKVGTERRSVQQEWALDLSLQQQSVLLLATRGPDGIGKLHPCKDVVRAYRGTVLVAAKFGRPLHWGERADNFMSLDLVGHAGYWPDCVRAFYESVDDLPHHYTMHLLHGAEIIGYKHPDWLQRNAWRYFYTTGVASLHLTPETEEEMDQRLGDWGRAYWDGREEEKYV